MDILFGVALSLHLGLENDYNNMHPHIRLEKENYVAGSYYNSENNISSYIGYNFDLDYFNLELGAVTGYDAVGKVIPYSRINKDFENKQLFLAPAVENINGEINLGIVLGVEFYMNE